MKHLGRTLMLFLRLGLTASHGARAQEFDPIKVCYGMRVRVAYRDAEFRKPLPVRQDGRYLGQPGALWLGTLGGLVGMVIGGIVASGEQWEEVPVENLEVGITSRPEMGTGLTPGFGF